MYQGNMTDWIPPRMNDSVYPLTEQELAAAENALDEAITGSASLTSCVHAALGAIHRLRDNAGTDIINHPPHYNNHPSGVETLEVTRLCGFSMGNAIKYCWRYADKNGVEDLKKARFYLKDLLATGQASRPPFKANELLRQVVAADHDLLRIELLGRIRYGQIAEAIALISREVGDE
jgi:hypothetical protein